MIEYVRWGPIGRLGLLRNLPTLFDGTHVRHPMASRQGTRRIEFSLDEPVDVMIDGEVLHAEMPEHRSASRRSGRAGMRTGAAESSEKSSLQANSPARAKRRPRLTFGCAPSFGGFWRAGFFFSVCPLLILLGIFVDPRKNDPPQRWLSRNLMRLAGVRVEVRRSPGFDPHSVCFFVSNHVNLFDPFVLYCAMPQFIRGLELESHFRIPVYGWLMKRFGNVPVPDVNRPADLKRMWRLTRAALERGVSLVVFPEGSRTITGRVGPFHNGVFRMAQDFGTPITPVSIVGSFTFHRKTSWILRPVDDRGVAARHHRHRRYGKTEVPELRERVWREVAGPIHASMGEALGGEAASTPEEPKA